MIESINKAVSIGRIGTNGRNSSDRPVNKTVTGAIRAVKINAIQLLALAVVLMSSYASANGRDVLFLGITDKRGEPAYAQLETELRHHLASNQSFRLQSEIETQRVIREIERAGRNRTEPFMPQNIGIGENTLIMRGVVEEFSFTPKRRLLLLGKIEARLTVMMYFNHAGGPVAYQGEFTSTASINKGALLFANPQKTIHISAPDRLELTRRLQNDIVEKVSAFSRTYFNSLETGPLHRSEDSGETANGENGDENTDGDAGASAESAAEDFPGAGELMTE